MPYRLSLDFSAVGPVEEVAAVELKSRLVGKDFHETSRRRVINRTYAVNLAIRRSVKLPVVVISASDNQLRMIFSDSFPDGMRLAEIKWSACHGQMLACWNEYLVDRSNGIGIDSQHMIQDGTAFAAMQVIECMI